MNIRQTRLILWWIAALLAMAGIASVAASLLLPYDLSSGPLPPPAPATRASRADDALPPLSAFAPLWRLDLRRPLADVATPHADPTTVPAAEDPGLPIRLIGTVVEEGNSYAIFISADGRLQILKAGEQVDGIEVLEIAANAVKVRRDGQTLTLSRPKPE